MACLNRSRTLLAPMPTNISTNSEPDMEKKGTLASPATALASMVLPVPGGPTSRIPLGMEAPMSWYFLGSWRYSTISFRLSLASSSPATSENLMPSEDFTYTLALDLPNIMALGPPMFFIMRLDIYCPRATKMAMGSTQLSRKLRMGSVC